MKKFFSNIKRYYKYALRSAKAELKSEVADSYLNWLWWIIEPICFMIIYTFVFGVIFQNKTPYFASFIFIGLTMWDFFNRMVHVSTKLIISNRDLVTKVYIPKYILLLSKSFTYLFKMAISLTITFGLMMFQGVPLTWHVVLILPIILVLYVFSFGVGCILMHFGVTLNDLANLTNIAMRMVFYLSGIFYNIKQRLKGKLSFILLRGNPMAFIIYQTRVALLDGKMISFEGLAFWFVVGMILCAIGVHLIHRNENSYAKVI